MPDTADDMAGSCQVMKIVSAVYRYTLPREDKKSVSNYPLSIPLQSAMKIWHWTMLCRKIN